MIALVWALSRALPLVNWMRFCSKGVPVACSNSRTARAGWENPSQYISSPDIFLSVLSNSDPNLLCRDFIHAGARRTFVWERSRLHPGRDWNNCASCRYNYAWSDPPTRRGGRRKGPWNLIRPVQSCLEFNSSPSAGEEDVLVHRIS